MKDPISYNNIINLRQINGLLSEVVQTSNASNGRKYLIVDSSKKTIATTTDASKASSKDQIVEMMSEVSQKIINNQNALLTNPIYTLRDNFQKLMGGYRQLRVSPEKRQKLIEIQINSENVTKLKARFDDIDQSGDLSEKIDTVFQNIEIQLSKPRFDAPKEWLFPPLELRITKEEVKENPLSEELADLQIEKKTTHTPLASFGKLGKEPHPTREAMMEVFSHKLEKVLNPQDPRNQAAIYHITQEFGKALDKIKSEVNLPEEFEEDTLSPEDAAEHFMDEFSPGLVETNNLDIKMDQKTFKELMGNLLPDGEMPARADLALYDAMHIMELKDLYESGAWEEKTDSKGIVINPPVVNRTIIGDEASHLALFTLLDKLDSNPQFKKALIAFLSSET